MDAHELLKAGQLSAALTQVTEEVKAKPADTQGRTFLFELLCFSGDLDRAAKQLDVLGGASADSELAVQRYRGALKAERARRRLFSEGWRPYLTPETPPYTEFHFRALNCLRESHPREARTLLEEAEASRPARAGRLNGNKPFDDIKDCDDLVGPFLEAIIQGEYHWIPWESISSIAMEAPKHTPDLIWIPAQVEIRSGVVGDVFLPALYANSYAHPDERVKLGRVTEWRPDITEIALGAGQRLLAVGDEEFPFLEVREIRFEDANTTGN